MINFLPIHLRELGAFPRKALLSQSVKRFMSFISKAAIIRKMLQQKSVAPYFQRHARILLFLTFRFIFSETSEIEFTSLCLTPGRWRS